MKRLDQRGSHILGLVLLVLVLGVVVFTGYKVAHRNDAQVASTTAVNSAAVPKAVTSTASLNQASTALDSSSAQLNSSLDDSSLNADMNDML